MVKRNTKDSATRKGLKRRSVGMNDSRNEDEKSKRGKVDLVEGEEHGGKPSNKSKQKTRMSKSVKKLRFWCGTAS